MRRIAAVPAFQAARTLEPVVRGLLEGFDEVWVVDDGSTDGTAEVALAAGARLLRHDKNRGKGAALRTALLRAADEGVDALVTVDADGQHPPAEAVKLDRAVDDRGAFVIGVRDWHVTDVPPRSLGANESAAWWFTVLTGRPFSDTQCGLRRYPVAAVLALDPRGARYAFEADALLRATFAGLPVVEVPVRVDYPPDRSTAFLPVRDVTRITLRVIATAFEHAARAAARALRGAPLIQAADALARPAAPGSKKVLQNASGWPPPTEVGGSGRPLVPREFGPIRRVKPAPSPGAGLSRAPASGRASEAARGAGALPPAGL